MHSRHRSPGNGYRSNSMRIGSIAAPSRISPESSTRGHGMYSSEYRNYNRGFGRGQPKPLQAAHHPARRESKDIFMEAGRLATEYLVSKGLLPPNALSGKWQNGSSKNQVVDFQGYRQQEGDNLHLPQEGRTSALARLGNIADAGSGRRRFSDEYNQAGSRSYVRGRGRMGSFKNYGPDWGREMGRNGSWSEKARPSPEMEVDDDSLSGCQEEQQAGNDVVNGVQKSPASELATKSDCAGAESALEKSLEDVDTNASSASSQKGLAPETDIQLTKRSDDMEMLNEESAEQKDGTNSNQVEKQTDRGESLQLRAEEDDSLNKNAGDLLSLCRFAKVPTKTRSSLTNKGTKVYQVTSSKEDKNHDMGFEDISHEAGQPAIGPRVPINDVQAHNSVEIISNQIQISKSLDSLEEASIIPAKDVGELIPMNAEKEKSMASHFLADKSFANEQESSEGPPGFGKSSFMLMERGVKRAAQEEDSREGMKKSREWVPLVVNQTDEHLRLAELGEKVPTPQEETRLSGNEVILDMDQENPVDMSLFQRGDAGSYLEQAEEKQLFPGSFKICDLNLMETSEVNENPDAGPVLVFPPIPERKKEASTIDVDLSISNNCNISKQYGRCGTDGKGVEVIDLENDSVQEDKAFNNLESKAEPAFTGLESFSNHAPSTNDISDVQDGYGLMFSEFLGTDISNCSSVPPDINSLHHDMALHNGEGILGDDESIYMSLGEIPISFLRVWEQQTQEYEKPF
ncbi:hypothetical protein NMG60_11037476 [Bertholletia excelsa]